MQESLPYGADEKETLGMDAEMVAGIAGSLMVEEEPKSAARTAPVVTRRFTNAQMYEASFPAYICM